MAKNTGPKQADPRSEGQEAHDPVPVRMVIYTIGVSLLTMAGFAWLVATHPIVDLEPNETLAPTKLRTIAVFTLGMVTLSGVLGGCLYSLRGISKHSSEDNYCQAYTLEYYVRPVSSGISGLVAFFLLLGGSLTLSIGQELGTPSWIQYPGLLPYVALSLLAGYASTEFKQKLKAVARSFFATEP